MIFSGLFPVAWWSVPFSFPYGVCVSGLCGNVFKRWQLKQWRPDLTARLLKHRHRWGRRSFSQL